MPKLRLNLLGNFQAFLDGVPVGGSDGAATNTAWQAWLQDAATNQRLGIACLEKLFVFLMITAQPHTFLDRMNRIQQNIL